MLRFKTGSHCDLLIKKKSPFCTLFKWESERLLRNLQANKHSKIDGDLLLSNRYRYIYALSKTPTLCTETVFICCSLEKDLWKILIFLSQFSLLKKLTILWSSEINVDISQEIYFVFVIQLFKLGWNQRWYQTLNDAPRSFRVKHP